MKKHLIEEQMNAWTKVLERSNELFAMAKKEADPAKAMLIKKLAKNLSNEFNAHGTIRKRKGMTEEQLIDSIRYAQRILDA